MFISLHISLRDYTKKRRPLSRLFLSVQKNLFRFHRDVISRSPGDLSKVSNKLNL